jgi:hypothetical protein
MSAPRYHRTDPGSPRDMATRTLTGPVPAPVHDRRTPRERWRAVGADLRFAAGVIFDAVRWR